MAARLQRSFSRGEISPSLYARTDLAQYRIGLRTCRNFVIMRQGGASYRPGLIFSNEVKNSAQGQVRLIPFIFNKDDAMVMEFGNAYVRFTQNGAPVVNGSTPVEVVTPYSTADVQTLNFVQTGDVVWLVHPNYPPATLTRMSNTSWAYTVLAFQPSVAAPTGISVIGTVFLTGHTWLYAVSAISDTTGEESFVDAQPSFHAWADPTETTPHTVTWTGVPNCSVYNVYLALDKGALGFLGIATSANLTFVNTGNAVLDPTTTPVQPFTDFTGAGNYPSVVGAYQQRLVYAGTLNNPAKVWCSRPGNYSNFNVSLPIQDDGPITFTIISDEIDEIEWLVVLGKMIFGTQGAEWLADGDPNGVLTPSSVNDRIGSYNGTSHLRPVKVGSQILYVQAEGNAILALKVNVQYGYYTFGDDDLTLISGHLLKGLTVADWSYQKSPNYTVWAIRSDGVLLSLTYMPAQELAGWARHDTLGTFENICVVPEGTETAVYVVVNRTIQGVTRRYIEQLADFEIVDDVNDPMFMDSALEYDGRNAGAASSTTMTLSGGTTWGYDQTLTLTASHAFFTAAMLTNLDVIVLYGSDGSVIRFKIDAGYSSSTVVTGHTNMTVSAALQNTAVATWDHAVTTLTGMDHLDGENVSVYADGYVVASPNNEGYATVTVNSGTIILPSAYTHIWAGLPYTGDLETLDLDSPPGKMQMTRLGLYVEASRGTFVGQALPQGDGITGPDPKDPTNQTITLDEIKFREETDDLNDAPNFDTKYMYANIAGRWNRTGRGVIRQVDPLPLNVLAIVPQGDLRERAEDYA